jgi:hypothetical protein
VSFAAMSSWPLGEHDEGIWRAEPVDPPRRRAPSGARLVRVRLRDRPGSLAAVATRLAAHGVDVLGLEVLGREAGLAIDDLLLMGRGLDAALAELAPEIELLGQRADVDLVDPGLAMAAACSALASARNELEAYRQLVTAALGLVFAEAGFVSVSHGNGVLRPMASTVADLPAIDDEQNSLLRSALWSGDPLTADGRVPWAPARYRELLPAGTVAVIPGGGEAPLVLTLIREDDAPFVAAELARLAALVEVAVGMLGLHTAVARRRPGAERWRGEDRG